MADTGRKRFGRKLYRMRMAQMLNEQEVADRAGIKLATLQKIEAGKFNIPFDVMNRVAVVLDCELSLKYIGKTD